MEPIEAHAEALTGFSAVVEHVGDDDWGRPTPCTEWDTRALVEHVIGFHEFLLLRPLGVRAHRPRTGSSARWRATESALRRVLANPEALGDAVEYFDGSRRRPIAVLDAMATDTLVHTWDLARAVGAPDRLHPVLCESAFSDAVGSSAARAASALFAAPVPVAVDAGIQERLLGLLGRDPGWQRTRRA
jgi:uncharacterized protein (TIGR03086 family)